MNATADTGDGIDEVLTTSATVALTAAARAGEHLARVREQSQRAAQAQQSGQQLAAPSTWSMPAPRTSRTRTGRRWCGGRSTRVRRTPSSSWPSTTGNASAPIPPATTPRRPRRPRRWAAGAETADQAAQTHQATTAHQQPDRPQWDSRERRQELADTLHQAVDNPTAVQARLTADTANARPPQDAVHPGAGRATPSPRSTPAPGRVLGPGL